MQSRRQRGEWVGRSVNPISTRVDTLSPPITTRPPPPGFQTLKWNFKPQISSVFHFDRASDGWIRGLECDIKIIR